MKPRKKTIRIWLSVGMLFLSLGASAQVFTGKVVDEQAVPVGYATVALYHKTDSSVIQGGITGEDGRFSLKAADSGTYMVQISFIGFQTRTLESAPCDLGTIVLKPDVLELGDVIVTGYRPKYKAIAGGISTQVENNVLGKAGTAKDVIGHLAGIRKKIDGTFEVIGKGAPVVYINNRMVRDQSELERLRSDAIQNIQLITNPGPEYDASVGAVLKIKTKKNSDDGFGISVSSEVDYADKFNTSQQLDMNYRQGGLSLFGSFRYDLTHPHQTAVTDIETRVDERWTQAATSEDKGSNQGYFGQIGANYEINSRHSLGGMYELTSMPRYKTANRNLTDVFIDDRPFDSWNTSETAMQKSSTHHVNAYYAGEVGKLTIDFNADALLGDGSGSSEVADRSLNHEDYLLGTSDNYTNRLFAGKLVLSYPVWKGKLSLGSEYTDTYRRSQSSGFEEIITASDDKITDGNVAVFTGYEAAFGPVNVNAGFRYEHVTYDFYENGLFQADRSKFYDNFFPSVSLNAAVGKTQFSLDYRIQTIRPMYEMLNSAVSYGNRLTYLSGTPDLQPTYINSVNFGAIWRNNLQVLVGYNHYKDDIFFAFEQLDADPKITVNKFRNEKSRDELFFSAAYAPTFGVWQPKWSVAGNTQWLDIEYLGKPKNMDGTLFHLSWENAITLPTVFLLRIDGGWDSDGYIQNRKMKSSWYMNASFNKEFAGGKWNILLEGNDLFHTMRDASYFYDGKTSEYRAVKDNTRQIKLTVSYRFNHKENKYKGTGAGTEEMQRFH